MASSNSVCLMILFYRKKGMSFEEFDKYWEESHGQLALSLPIFHKNLLKYQQIHVNRDSIKSWEDDGNKVSGYDGIVVLEATSEDKIREIFQDEEYLEKLAPDEKKFTERTSITLMPAHVVTILDTTT